MNFAFICSNIPAAPVYGVYISQLIRYSGAFGSYQDFLRRRLLLTRKLLNQGFLLIKLKSSCRTFMVATMTWLTAMEYLCHKWPRICFTCREHFPVVSSFMTYHRVCNEINTTGATGGAGTAYPSGAPEFTPGFSWGSCYSIFSFMYMFCRLWFVLLSVLRFTDSDYPFGIFKLLFSYFIISKFR